MFSMCHRDGPVAVTSSIGIFSIVVSIAVKEITIFDQAIQRKWHVADFSEMELAKAVHRALEDGAMASEGYIAEGEQLTKPIAMFQGDRHRLTITFF
jgi:hypothetical protein